MLVLSSPVDQIEPSSQCTTAMSLNPTQKSESDEPGYVSLDKQNEPDMRTTPEVCAGSDEEEKDGITGEDINSITDLFCPKKSDKIHCY